MRIIVLKPRIVAIQMPLQLLKYLFNFITHKPPTNLIDHSRTLLIPGLVILIYLLLNVAPS